MANRSHGSVFRIVRAIIVVALILLLLPYVLTLVYRVADPVSTLMLWRRVTGERVERTWMPLTAISP
jgi:monofunctional biosynthetic peptidoglycan transglycosylase